MPMLGSKCSKCCCEYPCPCTHGESRGFDGGIGLSDPTFSFSPLVDLPRQFGKATKGIAFPFDCKGNPYEGPSLLEVKFDATCFGSGVAATAEAPGGDNTGPVSVVTLTDGGSGYAVLGRKEPTLAIANANTTPAEVTIELSTSVDECGRDLWSVKSISVDKAGAGYTDGQSLSLSVSEGDVELSPASGTIHTTRLEPILTVGTADGTGATFTVALTKNAGPPPTWSIDAVTFTGSTSGYVDEQSVEFSGDGLVEASPAAAFVVTKRNQPTLTLSIASTFGAGGTLTPTITSNANSPETWTVSSVSIGSAGADYADGDTISATPVGAIEVDPLSGYVSAVDGNGGIVAVTLFTGGEYYEATDELESIRVDDGGQYYKDEGAIESITVDDGGSYYGEDPELPPYVSEITGVVYQNPGVNFASGSGATVEGTVDDDTESATFGKVVSLELTNPGKDYRGWDWLYENPYAITHFIPSHLIAADDSDFDLRDRQVVISRCCISKEKWTFTALLSAWDADDKYGNGYDEVPGVKYMSNVSKQYFELEGCEQTESVVSLNDAAAWETGFAGSLLDFGSPCAESLLAALADAGITLTLTVDQCECGACETDEGCEDTRTEAYCDSIGGTFQGVGTTCNPLP